MHELISFLMLWLSFTFGLPETSTYPQVRHLPPEQIAAIRYGGPGIASGADVVAVYRDRVQTIFLRDDWDSRRVADVSALVHELVHHLQNVTSANYACPAEREALAFEAQERWLQLFGEDLESAFGIDAVTLKLRTSCMLIP